MRTWDFFFACLNVWFIFIHIHSVSKIVKKKWYFVKTCMISGLLYLWRSCFDLDCIGNMFMNRIPFCCPNAKCQLFWKHLKRLWLNSSHLWRHWTQIIFCRPKYFKFNRIQTGSQPRLNHKIIFFTTALIKCCWFLAYCYSQINCICNISDKVTVCPIDPIVLGKRKTSF